MKLKQYHDMVLNAIEILQWAESNGKTIKDACENFGVSDQYIRSVKNKKQKHKDYNKFIEAYNKYKSIIKSNPIVDEDLLDKNTVVDKPSVKFIKEQHKGILDARGNKHVKTLEQLIIEAKIDTNLWNVDKHVINKWDVTTGGGATYQNWQVKAWLSKNKSVENAINANDLFIELLKKHNPLKYKPVPYKKYKENNLLEINIFDLHVGKLAWSGETGENYDSKIASKRFHEALSTLISRANGFEFERILFPIGNDFFNSDTIVNTTTAGTFQDEDLRWQKTFRLGVQLLIEGIDYMRQYAPVDVVVVPGNHDFTRSFYLGETLLAWYRFDKSVSINNHASPRKYYMYGTVLLGLTHGNEEKEANLPQLMAFEQKENWAKANHREWHLGHLHKKRGVKYIVPHYDENLGVMIRRMSSLAGTDAWHHKVGYVGTSKAAEAYLWNAEGGLTGQFNVNVKIS